MVKRTFDLFVGSLAFFVLSPLLLLIYILVKIDSRGPVLFVQRRIGMNNQEFLMYKFRTMIIGTPEVATDKLGNSERYVTKVGYYLRKYSLDELPQLLNIIKGDMSFVGPRPALYNQYDLREKRNSLGIAALKPGLTGWAQINGRDDVSLDEKVGLDFHYLQHQSFVFDMSIIFGTVFSVFKGDGVVHNKNNNMKMS